MTPNQIKSTLDQVLLNSNPSLHADLKAKNRLDETLQPILAQAMASTEEARNEAIASVTQMNRPTFIENPMERVQTLNSLFKAAEDVALAQAIEEVTALEAA